MTNDMRLVYTIDCIPNIAGRVSIWFILLYGTLILLSRASPKVRKLTVR
jgi:hypothetical protein